MIVMVGLTAMAWLLMVKWNLDYTVLKMVKKIPTFKDSSINVCMLCVTFWMAFTVSIVVSPFGLSAIANSVIRALVVTPFVIALVKDTMRDKE